MALGLWYELRPHGVDVVRAHVGPTDTPATRAMFTEKGLKSVPIQPTFEVSGDCALPPCHARREPWRDCQKILGPRDPSEGMLRLIAFRVSRRVVSRPEGQYLCIS